MGRTEFIFYYVWSKLTTINHVNNINVSPLQKVTSLKIKNKKNISRNKRSAPYRSNLNSQTLCFKLFLLGNSYFWFIAIIYLALKERNTLVGAQCLLNIIRVEEATSLACWSILTFPLSTVVFIDSNLIFIINPLLFFNLLIRFTTGRETPEQAWSLEIALTHHKLKH